MTSAIDSRSRSDGVDGGDAPMAVLGCVGTAPLGVGSERTGCLGGPRVSAVRFQTSQLGPLVGRGQMACAAMTSAPRTRTSTN